MRKDPTLSFFEHRRPDWVETLMPVIPAATKRTHLHSPGWNRREGPTSWAQFTETVLASPTDATYFLDSSFLHRHEIPGEVFAALLTRRIVVTSLIWEELKDWVGNPFANRGFRDVLLGAKERGHSSVLFLNPDDWSADIRESARYYVSLLSARKVVGVALKDSYATAHGREMPHELLMSTLQTAVGDRGVLLATKGLVDYGKPNFAADEDLVVAAAAHAILTGHETSILTRDRDPLEQFRKLLFLIDTHFRCHLIAESFLDTPENVIEAKGGVETPHDCFEPGDRSILYIPRRFVDWVLPKPGNPVMVHCHRLAGEGERMKFASLDFCAQKEMLRLLQVKGRTGGRNYDLPHGNNCHLVLSPPFPQNANGMVIIGKDRIRSMKDVSAPLVDVEYAVQEVQRIRRTLIDFSVCGGPRGTPGENLADFFLPKRLCFASEPGWESLEWEEFAKAIRFFDATALFFVDHGVVPSLRVDARRALIERGFRWPISIRDATLMSACEDVSPAERKALSEMATPAPREHGPDDCGFAYYLALLSLKRQFAGIIRKRVQNEHGRECRPGEVEAIAEYYGGISARHFVDESESNYHDPLLFVGDEMLVSGLIHGIMEGTDVVFLTKDPLFLDQFARLCGLVGFDYVASEYGRKHANDPSAFPAYEASTDLVSPADMVFGKTTCRNLPAGWHEHFLPRNPYLINVHCWLVGRDEGKSLRFAAWTYCAERGMHNLLRIKGSTGGRNVEGMNGRNVRAVFSTDSFKDAIVTVWNDRMIPSGGLTFLRMIALACLYPLWQQPIYPEFI